MALNIHNNMMSLYTQRQNQTNNLKLQAGLQKLASGRRINSAADDAAGLAISEAMRAVVTGNERAITNAQDGVSLVQTAEGGLGQVHTMLNRLTDLATQAANGTLDDSQRQMLQDEAGQLMSEIDRISQATNFNGKKLLDGSLSSNGGDPLHLQIGEGAEAQNGIDVAVDDMASAALGLSGIDLTSVDGALAALGDIRSAISAVSDTRGSLGSTQNRLEHTIQNLQVTNENLAAAESRIRDADMAKSFMDYTRHNILGQASTAMMAHSNIQSQQVLQLLK